jgi:hypothetical protein
MFCANVRWFSGELEIVRAALNQTGSATEPGA